MSKYLHASQGDLELEKALLGLDNQGLPMTVGNKYYVVKVSDAGYESFYKRMQETYDDGTKAVHNTIASAYAAVTSNRHDIIFINANGGHAQTAMLTIAKNRMHMVGMSFRGGSIGIGARARITMGLTTAATDLAVLLNTGVGNTFRGLKFDSSNTKAESLYGVIDAGEYAIWESCEFYKTGDKTETTAADLVANGDSCQFIKCFLGSGNVSNSPTTAVIRPTISLTETVSGKVCRDNIFTDCIIEKACGNGANRMVYGATAATVNRFLTFRNCQFLNNPESGASCAVAIDFGAGLTGGAVVVDQNCISVDVTVIGATGEGVYVLAPDTGTYANAGIAADA